MTDVLKHLKAYREVSQRLRNAEVRHLLDTQEGRALLHLAMTSAVNDEIDYVGTVRKLFRMHLHTPGALFRVAKGVQDVAIVAGVDGPESRMFGRYVCPDGVRLEAKARLEWNATEEEVAAVTQEVLRALVQGEDHLGLQLIHHASSMINTVTRYSSATLRAEQRGIQLIEDVRDQVEVRRLVVERFWINREDPLFVRKDGKRLVLDPEPSIARVFDECGSPDLRRAGFLGSIMNAQVLHVPEGFDDPIPRGTIYALTGPEWLGVMEAHVVPSSTELTIKGVTLPVANSISMCLPNSRAVARAEDIG